ncbi:flavin monoamine oxidase family protein [Vibrio ishigakensis]|uniref:flavin monoamine oxidase family protein n=1 Tax=Vibrio ishigakensis TaxID=1481914 RepID=UPI0021C48774|nr:NAD(P)/FAD-dependent oxidoreductase [Vibrio ishigakensis]
MSVEKYNGSEVIVIGAGLSGLIAAVRLIEHGVSVTLVDSEPRVGGRIYSVPIGGTHANLGAQYVFESDNEYMNKYVRRVDCFTNEYPKLFDPNTGNHGILWNGQFVKDRGEGVFQKLPIGRESLLQWDESLKQMAKHRKEIMKSRNYVFDKEPPSQLWLALDQMSGSDYLSKYNPDVEDLFNMMLTPEGGVGTSETSALLMAGWYGGEEKGMSYLVEGGNQEMAEAIAKDIRAKGGKISLSTKIISVENVEDKVIVTTESGQNLSSDYVIVTTPAPITRGIVKGLSAEKAQALEAVSYGASMQVALHIKDYTSDKKLASCLFHNEKVNAYMDQTRTHEDNETVVSINIAGSEAQDLDDSAILNRVAEPLSKIHPNFTLDKSVIDYKIKKWPLGIARFPPGFLTQNIDQIRLPVGRIYFAGDYTHSPELSGAAWSGVRAANDILSELS